MFCTFWRATTGHTDFAEEVSQLESIGKKLGCSVIITTKYHARESILLGLDKVLLSSSTAVEEEEGQLFRTRGSMTLSRTSDEGAGTEVQQRELVITCLSTVTTVRSRLMR